MSIEEYRQKMELYMMRVGIREEKSMIMARFISGLGLKIICKVKLPPYCGFHDLVQMCIKVEQQILKKGPGRSSYSSSYP